MKKEILFLILLAACVAQPQITIEDNFTIQQNVTQVQEKIVEKIIVQCWDNSTANSVEECPAKESLKVFTEEVAPPKVHIAKKLLNEAQNLFSGYAYVSFEQGVEHIVIIKESSARHLFPRLFKINDTTFLTDVYVDLENKTAAGYCNIERESRLEGLYFEYYRSKCKDLIDVPINVSFDVWLPRSPIYYLEQFADQSPVTIEDSLQTISIGDSDKSIQPSLHYEVDGKRIILRIDKRYRVPIRVEKEGEDPIDFRDAYFDMMLFDGKQVKINDSWVNYEGVPAFWLKNQSNKSTVR